MANVTMTLYEAMSKKKIYEARLSTVTDNKIKSMMTCKLVATNDKVADGTSLENAKSTFQSRRDSIFSIIKNYTNIKSAINDANAKTIVNIGGNEYSIANAIARQRVIAVEKSVYKKILNDCLKTEAYVETQNAQKLSSDAISTYISTILRDGKKDDKLVESLSEKYMKDNELEIYDPLNIREEIEKKLDDIQAFEEQIHFVLTKANVETTITVDLDD